MLTISEIEFGLLRKLLLELSGIEVPESKKYLFTSRLGEFIHDHGFSGFSELYNRINGGRETEIVKQFVQSMTTHESSFFRDIRPFTCLSDTVLPAVAAAARAKAKFLPPRIRIFSAGCSHGQETYSIAMCVREWLATQNELTGNNITILGGDISEKALQRARDGTYLNIEIGTTIPPSLRLKYFTPGDTYHAIVNDEIKKMVEFRQINLSEQLAALGKFDIIFCRNVIIYFTLELKKTIFRRFHAMLHDHGALFLGASESVFCLTDHFKICNAPTGVYYVPVALKPA